MKHAQRRSFKRTYDNFDTGVGSTFTEELRDLINSFSECAGFRPRYLQREAFSKYLDVSLVSAEDRRQNAIEKWLAAELRNRATNQRLLFVEEHDFGWVHGSRLVTEIRRDLSRILGPVPDDVLTQACHTNGASTRIGRSPTAAITKLTSGTHVSRSAVPHWLSFLFHSGINAGVTERMLLRGAVLQESSVLFTVPKKTDIDRVACKEPEINMALQRSVGLRIRKRLRKFGIDLNDQTVNQRLAATAVENDLATIDLSSASDTISRQLVFTLLPFEWWSLLDDLRVKSTIIDGGSPHELEMFSSMGNGFTFELESLLFFSITRVVCRLTGLSGRISVYGDDIIAPCAIVPRLSRVFHFFGFVMNPKKTHSSGSFRESCGKHYWDGLDVTPFYIRKRVSSLPELILHLNHLLHWDGFGEGAFWTTECAEFWLKWRTVVPKELWGGHDTSSPYALVTGHKPRKRLTPRTRRITADQELALDHWLWTKERTHDCLVVDPKYEVGLKAISNPSFGGRVPEDPFWIISIQ